MSSLIAQLRLGFTTLLFPPSCIACNEKKKYTCFECEQQWSSPPMMLASHPLMLHSVMRYDSHTSRIVLAAKEDGNTAARNLMALAIASAIGECATKRSLEITLVPIPSSRKNIRRRGEKFLIPILKKAIVVLHQTNPDTSFRISELLIQNPRVKEQSGLSLRERISNMSSALRIDERVLRNWHEKPVILVDDVITSGSSMRSAAKVLREMNLTVVAGVSACATSSQMPIR